MADWPSGAPLARTAIGPLSQHVLGPVYHAVAPGFAGNAWPAANRAIFLPVCLAQPFLLQKVGWMNGTSISGNVDVGVYNMDGTLIVSLGSTAHASGSGAQVGDIADTLLNPGTYMMAMVVDNTTATFHTSTNLGITILQSSGVQQQETAFPLATNASPATFANPTASYVPMFSLIGVTTL